MYFLSVKNMYHKHDFKQKIEKEKNQTNLYNLIYKKSQRAII